MAGQQRATVANLSRCFVEVQHGGYKVTSVCINGCRIFANDMVEAVVQIMQNCSEKVKDSFQAAFREGVAANSCCLFLGIVHYEQHLGIAGGWAPSNTADWDFAIDSVIERFF